MFTQHVVFATPPFALINAIFLNHSPQVRPSRPAPESTPPTEATPDFSYEPAFGDDHLTEGYPAVDDSSFPLRTQRAPTILDASGPSGTTTPPPAPASPSP